jgi:4-amino-4-deoxy-L-arabinose transferase-like glycosyltransferase
MAVAIKLFGSAEWVYCLYSLVASLASFVVLFVLRRLLLGPRAALYGAALLVLLPIDVFYATRAYADEALGLWNVAAFTAFVFAVRYGGIWPAILTGLLTGVAYVTK